MPVSSPASSPRRRQPTSAFPPFSEPDPDSESRPPSPYGERDPRQPQNNLYNWSPPRGALWSVLCLSVLLLNTLWGSYHSQLANAIPPLPSTAVASPHLPPCCRPIHCSSATFISHIPHCPELPHSRHTFATCAGANLINDSLPTVPQHACRPTYAAPHQPRCAPVLW